ncbi:HAD family phosphatase [Brasilonema sp. UFV-L1]|nr:HAD family phosphatase [Brasilonema sp. UFV-L1]NMG06157.1 HAD family phosphatase [Brasilonema sp. UFV-L1]
MSQHFKAAIFDMDGLLFDTESIARWAWKKALENHGYGMSDNFFNDLYKEFIGRDLSWREKFLKRRYGASFPFESVKAERIKIGDDREMQEGLPIKPGALELLNQLSAFGVILGLATGTSLIRTTRRLMNAGIYQNFATIVTSENVAQGKPAPDIFLEVSRRIDVAPQECVVFEDSFVGVEAASSARMCTIMVPDLEQPSAQIRSLAYKVLDSLEQASELLEELFGVKIK